MSWSGGTVPQYRISPSYFTVPENMWMSGRPVNVLRKATAMNNYYCLAFIANGDKQMLKHKLNTEYIVLSKEAIEQFNEDSNEWEKAKIYYNIKGEVIV